jgi:hypothetical protein
VVILAASKTCAMSISPDSILLTNAIAVALCSLWLGCSSVRTGCSFVAQIAVVASCFLSANAFAVALCSLCLECSSVRAGCFSVTQVAIVAPCFVSASAAAGNAVRLFCFSFIAVTGMLGALAPDCQRFVDVVVSSRLARFFAR